MSLDDVENVKNGGGDVDRVRPTSCTMVFMRGLRLVFPEMEIVSGKFIREISDIVEHAG